MNRITSYARIKNGIISVVGTVIYQSDAGADLPAFLSGAYKHLELNYPKFHKMDLLCKLGILCAEPVMKAAQSHDRSQTAIVLSNHASSLETDRQHQKSIADPSHYFPSPAVFVYTLPNIVIGEITIRHKVTGENAFFVSERFDAALMVCYTESLLNAGHAEAAVCGWVNVDGDDYDALIYLAEKPGDSNKNSIFKPHSTEILTQLYL